jgi:hypothetical protein
VTERGYLNGDGYGLGWFPIPTPGLRAPAVHEEQPCVFTR